MIHLMNELNTITEVLLDFQTGKSNKEISEKLMVRVEEIKMEIKQFEEQANEPVPHPNTTPHRLCGK